MTKKIVARTRARNGENAREARIKRRIVELRGVVGRTLGPFKYNWRTRGADDELVERIALLDSLLGLALIRFGDRDDYNDRLRAALDAISPEPGNKWWRRAKASIAPTASDVIDLAAARARRRNQEG